MDPPLCYSVWKIIAYSLNGYRSTIPDTDWISSPQSENSSRPGTTAHSGIQVFSYNGSSTETYWRMDDISTKVGRKIN